MSLIYYIIRQHIYIYGALLPIAAFVGLTAGHRNSLPLCIVRQTMNKWIHGMGMRVTKNRWWFSRRKGECCDENEVDCAKRWAAEHDRKTSGWWIYGAFDDWFYRFSPFLLNTFLIWLRLCVCLYYIQIECGVIRRNKKKSGKMVNSRLLLCVCPQCNARWQQSDNNNWNCIKKSGCAACVRFEWVIVITSLGFLHRGNLNAFRCCSRKRKSEDGWLCSGTDHHNEYQICDFFFHLFL